MWVGVERCSKQWAPSAATVGTPADDNVYILAAAAGSHPLSVYQRLQDLLRNCLLFVSCRIALCLCATQWVPGVWNSLVSQTFLYRVDVGKANPACRVLAITNNCFCLSVQGTNTDVGAYYVRGPALD